jgi:hypothetical protein
MQTSNHDVATGEVILRDLTDEEVTALQAKAAAKAAKELQAQAEAEAKAEAKAALLERLGITADEAALLLS